MSKGPFKYVESVNFKKPTKIENDYSSFIMTRYYSFFIDTIYYANEVNRYVKIEDRFPYRDEMQYNYFYNSVKKKKRGSQWFKMEKDIDIEMISAYYDCSSQCAKEYKELLTEEQLKIISKWFYEMNKKGE